MVQKSGVVEVLYKSKRMVVIVRESYPVLPSMPKREIFDQRLSLMSTQAAPGANPILHGNFDLPNYYILGQ